MWLIDFINWFGNFITDVFYFWSVGIAFCFGIGLGCFLQKRLFKEFQGKEPCYTSRGNSGEAWTAIINFVYDRYRLLRNAAIDPNPGCVCEEHIDILHMNSDELWQWLVSLPGGEFMWLCNVLGIRVDLSTKKELTEEDLKDVDLRRLRDHQRSWHGHLPTRYYSILAVFLASGGALLSIIAFIIYRVG